MAKKILIIDDDPIIVKYLKNIFTDNGYEICTAASGVEGSDVVQRERPDLITLDLEMPEQWGPRFYRNLSKTKDLRDIPVIVISGLPSSKYSPIKSVAHFGKPFDVDKLLETVIQTIGEAG
jgi:CheY-like chemotaxis protein